MIGSRDRVGKAQIKVSKATTNCNRPEGIEDARHHKEHVSADSFVHCDVVMRAGYGVQSRSAPGRARPTQPTLRSIFRPPDGP